MLSNPLGVGYTTTNAQNLSNINVQQNQNQNPLSQEEIEQQAAVSRAKRLQRLLAQLNDVLDEAVEATPDAGEASEMEAAYLEYILARLSGEGEDLPLPEGFGDFAEELSALIDDVVRAWEALINAEEAFVDEAPQKVFEDLDAVIAILENIINRRIERLMSNNWYQQWRTAYRNDMLEDIKETHFAQEQPDFQALAPDMSAQELALANTGANQGRLVKLLQDAMQIQDPDTQEPLLNPVQTQAVSDLLSLLGEDVPQIQ